MLFKDNTNILNHSSTKSSGQKPEVKFQKNTGVRRTRSLEEFRRVWGGVFSFSPFFLFRLHPFADFLRSFLFHLHSPHTRKLKKVLFKNQRANVARVFSFTLFFHLHFPSSLFFSLFNFLLSLLLFFFVPENSLLIKPRQLPIDKPTVKPQFFLLTFNRLQIILNYFHFFLAFLFFLFIFVIR